MSDNPVLRVEEERARALGEAADRTRREERWKSEHERALVALDVEALVGMARQGPEMLRAAVQFTRKRLASDPAADYDAGWQSLDKIFQLGLHGMRVALDSAQRIAALGYVIDGVAGLADAIREVERLRRESFKTWPLNPRQVEESRACAARGEGQDVEDILRELQGQDSATG
jgi:hypothetical protein